MKRLTAYFSASGVTEKAAEALVAITGGDICRIEPAVPYTAADLDWTNRKSRSSVEMSDSSSRPEIRGELPDTASYDLICIGFPIWWGVAPRIINTFIEKSSLKGKKIVVFATSGGSTLGPAVKDLQRTYPELDITEGKLLNGKVTADIV